MPNGSLNKLRADLRHLRHNTGLDQYPYKNGLEGLRTALVCTLNSLLDLTTALIETEKQQKTDIIQDDD